jgi:NAD(P)H-hydrate epimerase
MESAGRAAADLAARLAQREPVVVLAGGGNNGGDALVAARTLRARGHRVRVILGAERPTDDPLLHGWTLEVASDIEVGESGVRCLLEGAGLVVDGLLGTGITGPPRERQARLIEMANAARAPILALDIASGVGADDGAVAGVAARAHTTISFGWPKMGALLAPGRGFTGRLVVAEIGFPPLDADGFRARLLTPAWGAGTRPRREPQTHKNAVGALTLVAGAAGMAGAAILAARAALRSGAGYVRVASVRENRHLLQTVLPDAPYVEMEDPDALQAALEAASAVAVGPGLGADAVARAALNRVLEGPARPTLLDADALNLVAAHPEGAAAVLGAAAEGRPLLVTPHPGEMARLTGRSPGEIQEDRPGAARSFSHASGATVLLKGMPSLVADPDGRLEIAGLASSDLAVAGMGDVLTGTAAAFLAQGLGPRDAAGLGLLAGALAARATGRGEGLAAGDVPDAIPGALRSLDTDPGAPPLPWMTLSLEAPR